MHDAWWYQLSDIYSRPVMSDTVGRPSPKPEMDDRLFWKTMGGREMGELDFSVPPTTRMPQMTYMKSQRGMLPVDHEPTGRWIDFYRRGMLDRIDGRIIPRKDAPRPKTPMNGGVRG